MVLSKRLLFAVLLIGILLSATPRRASSEAPAHQQRRLREPVAIRLDGTGKYLFTANRAGSVSIVDVAAAKVVREVAVGDRLVDLALVGPNRLAVVDEARDEVVLLHWDPADRSLRTDSRIPVSDAPVSILSSDDLLTVASLWSHRVTLLELTEARKLKRRRVVDLPFAPRAQLLLPDDKTLVVGDAFGGELAIIDVQQAKLSKSIPMAGHQIRALSLSRDGKDLLIPHQLLRDEATTHNGVHWGGVMSNVIRKLPLQRLLEADDRGIGAERLFFLGHPGQAHGDPTKLHETSNGRHVVTFAGVAEVGISDVGANYYRSVKVGARPTDLVYDEQREVAYTANTFDDSISIVNIAKGAETQRISLGPKRRPTTVETGERLFYNARLAVDGWYSCNSCHVDGHTNGRLNDNLGDGSFGAPKRVLSLLGVGDTAPWAWRGQTRELQQQIHASIVKTMRGAEPAVKDTRAIADFLRSLKPAPGLDRSRGVRDEKSVLRGATIFQAEACTDCHVAPTYTSKAAYDVGLPDEVGRSKFNPPSLRGVSQRRSFFHDNSATSLGEVLDSGHNLSQPLMPARRKDLLAFLRSL